MTGTLMRLTLTVAACLSAALAGNPAVGKVGRSLPEKQKPLVIEKVFQSPVGEVQFLSGGDETVYLRKDTGELCQLERVEGESGCNDYASLQAGERMNQRCVFFFSSQATGCRERVYSYELRETTLFKVVSRAHQTRIPGEE